MRKRWIVIGVAAAGLMALGAQSVAASTTRYPTTIVQYASWFPTSDPQVIFFAGNVHSPNHACVANRTVKEIAVFASKYLSIPTPGELIRSTSRKL